MFFHRSYRERKKRAVNLAKLDLKYRTSIRDSVGFCTNQKKEYVSIGSLRLLSADSTKLRFAPIFSLSFGKLKYLL